MREEDIVIEYDDPNMQRFYSSGRKTVEEVLAEEISMWEEGQPERDAWANKKKVAADELIALGVSKESAYLLANYYEEDVAKQDSLAKAALEDI